MKTQLQVSPRIGTIYRQTPRHEGRARQNRAGILLAAAASLALATALGACTPSASSVPTRSAIITLPSINASPLASAAAQAAILVLDQVDAALIANQATTSLSVDEQNTLRSLSADVRSRLQTGDMPSAREAFNAFSAKVTELAPKLNSEAGQRLKAAVAALGALIPAS